MPVPRHRVKSQETLLRLDLGIRTAVRADPMTTGDIMAMSFIIGLLFDTA